MSQILREEVAQRNLSTIDVATYLRTRGWERLEHPSRDVSYWRRVVGTERFEVLLPHHHEWSDHLDLLTALVDTLARAERRSALSLLHDLSTATCDVIRLRAVAGPSSDGTIGVGDGLRLVDCLRRVALAAACTAVEPRRAYHKRKFTEATRFVDRLRLGQTERGSFVLTALSSVTPALTEDPSSQEPDPFERKVTRTLAQALSGLEAAALQGSLENQIEPFEREVERGVSADLCEAIALLGESEVIEQVDFEIAWSPVRPAPPVTRRASFARGRSTSTFASARPSRTRARPTRPSSRVPPRRESGRRWPPRSRRAARIARGLERGHRHREGGLRGEERLETDPRALCFAPSAACIWGCGSRRRVRLKESQRR